MSLFNAMEAIINVFNAYAGKDGDASTLSKGEVKALLAKEFGAKCETADEKKKLEEMFQSLDANSDGKVDFQEFVVMVAALTAVIRG